MLFTEHIKRKIYRLPELQRQIAAWRLSDKRIVFTNGCFDILHKGHIDLLMKAAALGDVLIIGLNTDASVKRLKGETRPINNEDNRALMLASLLFVDAVILFEEDTPLQLISALQPDVLVKGGDYTIDTIVGADIVLQKGGRVEIIPFTEGFSTTEILNKITLL